MTILEELEAADNGFKRPAAPAVYAEYVAFMETGDYPYLDNVVRFIARRNDIADAATRRRFDVEAVKGTILRVLHHEVYLASGQYRVAQMFAREAELRGEGWLSVTELAPVDGMRVKLASTHGCAEVTYRCKPAGRGDWALLEPRKRSHGLSLRAMQAQYRAYEAARDAGNLGMSSENVRMFQPA